MSRRAISYLHAETDALIETQSLGVFLVSPTSISHNTGHIESRACRSYRALLFPPQHQYHWFLRHTLIFQQLPRAGFFFFSFAPFTRCPSFRYYKIYAKLILFV